MNGVGKSTLTASLILDTPLAGIPIINPDTLTNEILAERPIERDTANFAALRLVSKQITEYIVGKRTFLSETVLANSAYRRHAEHARAVGFGVKLLYVALPTVEHAIARIADRVSKGGHSVPEAVIRRRWRPSHQNLTWFAANADEVDVFSNAAYGGPAKLVATVRNGVAKISEPTELPEVTAALSNSGVGKVIRP